ncbi:kinesin-like protein KIN-UC [Silene latifolia]|uniref:kinesin-like protein KIN-UC n=1 Tax=Silene latifolia TaxID=37657 RepID=UPI003D7776C4
MATQRSGKERQTWQTPSSASLLNLSTNSLTKSVNAGGSSGGSGGAGGGGGVQNHHSNRSSKSSSVAANPNSERAVKRSVTPVSGKRSVTPLSRSHSIIAHDPEPGRVRVAIRLRPRNDEDLALDADFADCVDIQPELKKLNLKKNNWSSDSYKFDEVFTETASQKRVYEVVAKPVVESVMSGYNGTVMAYGQTGTGKTHTVGNLGKNDASERGIMVRAVEDIITNISPRHDSVEISYLQLYKEAIQDLLAPEKVNIPIVEDAKTGEVLLPGASVIKIHELDQFMELLQNGEANRHAANTKLNTNSSRSHAILTVYVRRSITGKTEHATSSEMGTGVNADMDVKMIRKSKLLIVDLAGSERIDKSGSEGHLLEEAKFINLSLTSLGKCINALAENSPHIPVRDSKLTRILRDSFGGSARTSLIITIGPSARHHAETTSTIMFGQRAMKVVNMMKVKEEFDYESLCRKLESKVDNLTKEIDREQKLRDNYINEMEKKLKQCQRSFMEAEKSLVTRSEILEKDNARLEMEMKVMLDELNDQKECNKLLRDDVARLEMSIEHYKQNQYESSTHQKALADATQMYEKQISAFIEQLKDERARSEGIESQLKHLKALLSEKESSMKQCQAESSRYHQELLEFKQKHDKKVAQLTKQLDDMLLRCEHAEKQVDSLRKLSCDQSSDQKLLSETIQLYEEKIAVMNKQLQDKHESGESLLEEIELLKKALREEKKSQSQEKSNVSDLMKRLEEKAQSHQAAVAEVESLKAENSNLVFEKEKFTGELDALKEKLLAEEKQRLTLEDELVKLKKRSPENSDDVEDKKPHVKQHMRESSSFRSAMGLSRSFSGQKATIAKICEEVGLEKILKLLSSEDIEVQMHALKVVANLAAEDINQEKIVNDGGLDALLMLLRTSQNTTILRVASGAVANLAMNETNQGMIMSKGGAQLLSETTLKTDDPQTLRMVAGAIANLCGNVSLHSALQQDGGIKALVGMTGSANADVIAQVARGLANFAKCETREVIQGHKNGRSLLMEDGALTWLIVNSKTTSESTRRHIELALCHLAQNEDNTQDFISTGGLREVMRISSESAREDIRNLAKKTLKLNPTFHAQLRADR